MSSSNEPGRESTARCGVLNIGCTRYSMPLEPSHRKKFERLSRLARLHVVGLSKAGSGRRFEDSARFYLLPLIPAAALRFLAVFVYSLVKGFWLGRRREIQIVLCESPYEGLAGIVIRGALSLVGTRVVVATELHGDWQASPFLYRRVPFRRAIAFVLDAWTGFVLRRSDLLRAVSQTLREKAENIGARPVALVFPTFTDFDLFLQPLDAKGAEERTSTALYAGALYPIKGLDTLIEAMARLVRARAGARLLVVGEGPYRTHIERRIAEQGLKDNVALTGSLPPEGLRQQMLRAHFFVLPSLSEGLPRVIVEAMACGLPVVASDTGGIPELVEEGMTGFLVPPGDTQELAEKMRWLMERPEQARRMGVRARGSVEKRFSAGRYFEGYRQLFSAAQELLSES